MKGFSVKVLRNLLADDEDMMSLSLTNQNEKEDIELLLSSVAADLDEIETEIKIFIDMIEDTDQFISAHLDSVRNEIIKMSLFIEGGGLIMVKINIWRESYNFLFDSRESGRWCRESLG